MPVEYEFLDKNKGVLIRGYGHVEGVDMIKAMQEIFNDEETIKSFKYGIVDYSEVDNFNISHDQIFSLSMIHIDASKLNPNIVVGFAINKPLIYGLVRIWMVYANMTGWTVNIKKDLPAIQKWVNESVSSL